MTSTCVFTLNGRGSSTLVCPGIGAFPAFSGNGVGRDNPNATDKIDIGPLPAGRYYIVERASGGPATHLRDAFLKLFYGTDRWQWFALYRADGKIDDYTFVSGVRRGAFRLHPVGPRGLSEGCITLMQKSGFEKLAGYLRQRGAWIPVPGTGMRAYGIIEVKP